MNTSDLDAINAVSAGKLPGLVGLVITNGDPSQVEGHIEVREDLLAPNGFLHAASIIALVDSLCGYGAMANLPDGAVGFTTVELKSNFMGTARDGRVLGEAKPVHWGGQLRSGMRPQGGRRTARCWRYSGAPRWCFTPGERRPADVAAGVPERNRPLPRQSALTGWGWQTAPRSLRS